MIEKLQEYFSLCPLFEGKEVNIDYLGTASKEVSIIPGECNPIIKSYKTGGSLRQYCFEISFRGLYRGSPSEGLENERLCEELSLWCEGESENNNLPVLNRGCTAQKLEVTKGGMAKSEATNHACYRIGLRLIYTKM